MDTYTNHKIFCTWAKKHNWLLIRHRELTKTLYETYITPTGQHVTVTIKDNHVTDICNCVLTEET